MQIERFKGRRIQNISTATLQWLDTKLTYLAVVARGSPIVTIICFKHNENKLYSLFTLNTCPSLENPDTLEQNDGQTYLSLPSETKLSLDCEFLSITSFDGTVKLVKMPPILDPMQNDKSQAAAAEEATPMDSMSYNQNSTGELKKAAVLSGDLEDIEHTVLELATVLLASLPPKKVQTFDDPYKYTPPKDAERGESTARESTQMAAPTQPVPAPTFKYLLGKEHVKDTEGGDAGSICKVSAFHPTVEFIRSQFCGRQ